MLQIIEEQERENNYFNPLSYLDLSQRKNEFCPACGNLGNFEF